MGVGSKGLKFRNQFQETRERERRNGCSNGREGDRRQTGWHGMAGFPGSVGVNFSRPPRGKELKLAAWAISVFCQTKTDRKRARRKRERERQNNNAQQSAFYDLQQSEE